jgi:outer membrane protein
MKDRRERFGARVVVVILALVGPLPSFGAEDLVFHYRHALTADPRLRAVEANKFAAQERKSQATAGFFPTISATAGRNRNDESVLTDASIFSQPAGQAHYSSSEYRLTLSQPVVNAALIAGVQVADAESRRAEAEYTASRQEVAVRTAQAYFDVLLAQESVVLARAERTALAQQRESVEARQRARAATIIDLNDVLARFQIAVAQEIEAANQLADKREALQEISGQAVGELATLGQQIPLLRPEPDDSARWVEAAVGQNPQLLAARAAVESARENVTLNRAGHLPTVSFVGNRIRSDADASIAGPGVRSDSLVYGLQLNVPLSQGGLVNARIDEAAYRHEAALQDLEARRRAVVRATRAAFQGTRGAIAKIEALEKSVIAAGTNRAAKTEGYSAGLYTTLDVLDATRDLFRAKRDYAEARHAYVVNLLQLKLSAGALEESDLIEVNRWLVVGEN